MNCRGIVLRHSDYCRHHDVNWRRKRLEQLRTGTGKPPTPAEMVKLFRANAKTLWAKSPWRPLLTIWLTPPIEAAFVEDCRRAGVDLAETAPVILNTLRWVWRRSVLDRGDDEGWQRAVIAAEEAPGADRRDARGLQLSPPPDEPPGDPRIKQVHRRATGYELAAQTGPVDRSTKAKQRRQRSRQRQPPAKFDAPAFLAQHWSTVFNPLFKQLRIDPDDPIGARLAAAYHAVLDEQERLDGASGSAQRRWVELLRELTP